MEVRFADRRQPGFAAPSILGVASAADWSFGGCGQVPSTGLIQVGHGRIL